MVASTPLCGIITDDECVKITNKINIIIIINNKKKKEGERRKGIIIRRSCCVTVRPY